MMSLELQWMQQLQQNDIMCNHDDKLAAANFIQNQVWLHTPNQQD